MYADPYKDDVIFFHRPDVNVKMPHLPQFVQFSQTIDFNLNPICKTDLSTRNLLSIVHLIVQKSQ